MPVPLPGPDTVLLEPPGPEEVQATANGVASAIAPPDGLTDVQRVLLEALFPAMTGHAVSVANFEPVTPEAFAQVLARRDLAFRSRGVQIMLLGALVLRPLPPEVIDRVAAFARELMVDDKMIDVARRFATGSLGLAAFDFERNGYTSAWHPDDASALHTSTELAGAWELSVDDPALAARWAALADLPEGTLGRRVWEMYRARGFAFPGNPGSAPPLLAQHDWVHVLAELRHDRRMRAGGVRLHRPGQRRHAGVLAPGHGGLPVRDRLPAHRRRAVRSRPRSPVRRRRHGGPSRRRHAARRAVPRHGDRRATASTSCMVDWFELAHLPLDVARARFRVQPKSEAAVAAGSITAWEPGGISPFQLASGQSLAEREGRTYDSYGASVA